MAFFSKKPFQLNLVKSFKVYIEKRINTLANCRSNPNSVLVHCDGSRSRTPHNNVIGGGASWIARSTDGICLAKRSVFLPSVDDTLLFETYAAYHFTSAHEGRKLFHKKEIHLFSDSNSFLVKLLEVKDAREGGKDLFQILNDFHKKDSSRDLSFILSLCYHFCENMDKHFANSSSVNFIYGSENEVADCLANLGRYYFPEMSDIYAPNLDHEFQIQLPGNVSPRVDFRSIRAFLPPISHGPTGKLFWSSEKFCHFLDNIINHPSLLRSRIVRGLRHSLYYDVLQDHLRDSCFENFIFFYNEMRGSEESKLWIENVIVKMATLIKRLPVLLEDHYRQCEGMVAKGKQTGLRMFVQQHPGIVFLSKELVAALLSCSFFCLYPTLQEGKKKRKHIIKKPFNMDSLFSSLRTSHAARQVKNKLICICKYFDRLDLSMEEYVSFERKVLSFNRNDLVPDSQFLSHSKTYFCSFEIFHSSKVREHSGLEVSYIQDQIGGHTLADGCGQEEIRFVVQPELIVSMLFMPSMSDKESIEIVGGERFSEYNGVNDSFVYAVDERSRDHLHRRMTRYALLGAFDVSCKEHLLRELNKAYCSFLVHTHYLEHHETENVRVVAGSSGCVNDVQIQSLVLWAAASQASRPYVTYYTFGMDRLTDLDKVVTLIESERLTVGDIWTKLEEFLELKTGHDFFSYLLSRCNHDGN